MGGGQIETSTKFGGGKNGELVSTAHLELQGPKDVPESLVEKEKSETPGRKVLLDLLDSQENLDWLGLKEEMENQELQDQKGHRVKREIMDLVVHLVHLVQMESTETEDHSGQREKKENLATKAVQVPEVPLELKGPKEILEPPVSLDLQENRVHME